MHAARTHQRWPCKPPINRMDRGLFMRSTPLSACMAERLGPVLLPPPIRRPARTEYQRDYFDNSQFCGKFESVGLRVERPTHFLDAQPPHFARDGSLGTIARGWHACSKIQVPTEGASRHDACNQTRPAIGCVSRRFRNLRPRIRRDSAPRSPLDETNPTLRRIFTIEGGIRDSSPISGGLRDDETNPTPGPRRSIRPARPRSVAGDETNPTPAGVRVRSGRPPFGVRAGAVVRFRGHRYDGRERIFVR